MSVFSLDGVSLLALIVVACRYVHTPSTCGHCLYMHAQGRHRFHYVTAPLHVPLLLAIVTSKECRIAHTTTSAMYVHVVDDAARIVWRGSLVRHDCCTLNSVFRCHSTVTTGRNLSEMHSFCAYVCVYTYMPSCTLSHACPCEYSMKCRVFLTLTAYDDCFGITVPFKEDPYWRRTVLIGICPHFYTCMTTDTRGQCVSVQVSGSSHAPNTLRHMYN